MKGFLLDTHIWLWNLVKPRRLSNQVRSVLEDEKTELVLSPISVWEAILLGEKGRISTTPDPTRWVKEVLALSPLKQSLTLITADQMHVPGVREGGQYTRTCAIGRQ